ncbi:Rba50p KNAG_0F00140 [Huiozyma naganishii CBS 8797]|uniref:RNA polymerase II-associated protein RBA50 n=1 Tax=Huiozyma naganishii (strain ATCC MYA-139 / BCRC 22969 / CBS 8797 / KCTC 17520 / NBRC 10181 / NCYC 3082 / Yp74L-3) TaxID=1071383 RepID=J7S845_HUIN7|nr:hypothetical protein KNAG_0F00140 [Kazachstania naganishii CBS 8797]CCK70686.1 hypothetical protein KNAG_0F00140 [Kazachstania naganishii CBS 8797]
MDLLGDIVEKDVDFDSREEAVRGNKNGFPELYQPQKISSWKQRLRDKNVRAKTDKKALPNEKDTAVVPAAVPAATEAQRIHNENLAKIGNMSEEQILEERRQLLESLDPKLIRNLLQNVNKRLDQPLFAEIEGASGTWVGGANKNALNNLPSLSEDQVNKALEIPAREKKNNGDSHPQLEHAKDLYEVRDGNVEDADDIAPLEYQVAQSIDHMKNEDLLNDVHFMKKKNTPNEREGEPLDINDPDFNDKLHEKYFPDLPKDVDKLQWMQEVPSLPEDDGSKFVIDDVSKIRFDFRGNLVPPTRQIETTSRSALHHHSVDPQLAGYTLDELTRLARSTFASQRCIAIQTIGRILYKMGKQNYYQLVPEVEAETYKEEGNIRNIMNKIYSMFWDLIKDLQTIETLQLASDEHKTRSLSVRTYATDALWLWKKGGGDFRAEPNGGK